MDKTQIEGLLFLFALISAVGNLLKILEYAGIKMPVTKSGTTVTGDGAEPIPPQQKKPKLPRGAVVGMAFGLVGLILSTIGLSIVYFTSPEQTTAANAEGHLRQWVDYYHMASQRIDNPEAFFSYTVTLANGNPVTIERLKAREDFLIVESRINVSPEHRGIIHSLVPEQRARFNDEMLLQLNSARVPYNIDLTGDEVGAIIVVRKAAISTLNSDTFISLVDEIDTDIQISRQVIRVEAEKFKSHPTDATPREHKRP